MYSMCNIVLVEAVQYREDPPSSDIIEPTSAPKHELDGMAPPTHQSTKIERDTRDDNMANVVTELEGKLKKNQGEDLRLIAVHLNLNIPF